MSLINCKICVGLPTSSRKISGLIILKRQSSGTYIKSCGCVYTYRYERIGDACFLYRLRSAGPFQSSWSTVKIEALNYCETFYLYPSTISASLMSVKSVIFINPAVTIQASHSVNAPIAASFHILPNSSFTNPITRSFKVWDTDLLSSLAYGPYSLTSAFFSIQACLLRSSSISWHPSVSYILHTV